MLNSMVFPMALGSYQFACELSALSFNHGLDVLLTPDQERLLRGRYIHQSANWIPTNALFVNKPASGRLRNIYPNRPQKGYPQ